MKQKISNTQVKGFYQNNILIKNSDNVPVTVGELIEWLMDNTSWDYQEVCSRMYIRSAWQDDEWEDELIDELAKLCLDIKIIKDEQKELL